MDVLPTYISAPQMIPTTDRRGNQFPRKWSYQTLLAGVWVLGIKPKSSARAIRTL